MGKRGLQVSVEQWRPVAGWEEYYEVSDHGRVRSKDRVVPHRTRSGGASHRTISGRVLSQTNFRGRYWQVSLKADGIRISAYVHRLVCEAFHGSPPDGKPETAHYDGDGHNNMADNLRWASAFENACDRIRHGTTNRGERSPMSKLTAGAVRLIRKYSDRARDAEFASLFGTTEHTISCVRLGHSWKWMS